MYLKLMTHLIACYRGDKTYRNIVTFIKLNLYFAKYSLGEAKYSLGEAKYRLYFVKYRLGEAVCNKVLQVCFPTPTTYIPKRLKFCISAE